MTLEEARETPRDDDYFNVKAKIEKVIGEAKEDSERLAFHFGYFETSDGKL